MKRWRWLIAPVVLAVLGLVVVFVEQGLRSGALQLNRPDPKRFPVWGVDVSHHQGTIEWSEVARAPNLVFAYVKATEGGDWVDHAFAENWKGARGAGLRVGAYHYFTFCRPAADQAKNFLSVLPSERDTLPPALDVEFGGNCSTPPPTAEVRAAVLEWLEAVEQATSRRPIIYATRDAHEALLQGEAFAKYGLWIRDVFFEPEQDVPWVMWQFANRAHVDGIEGFVDLDALAGDRAALEQL